VIFKKFLIICLLSVLTGLTGILFAGNVKIVRTLPTTAENKVKASWSKPLPEPEKAAAGKTQFSGRLALGGSGGLDVSGNALYDLYSDSRFSLVQPLGILGSMSVSGTALRKNIIEGLNQNYSGKFALILDKLRFSAGISYTEKAGVVDVLNKDDASTLISSSLNVNYIDTLPLALTYSHSIVQKKEGETTADTLTEDYDSDNLNFKMLGSLGEFGIGLISGFSRKNDKTKNMQTNGFDNSLAVTSPLLGFVKIKASIAPVFSTVDYISTGNKLTSTTLNSDLGLIFPVSNSLTFTTGGGRYDSWVSGEGPESSAATSEPYTNGWKASTGVEYKVKDSLSAEAKYQLKKSKDVFNHNLKGTFGLTGKKESWFKKAGINGELAQSFNSAWSLSDDKISWGSSVSVEPLKKLSITSKYSGGMSGVAELNWINSVSAGLTHEPDPMLNYGVTAELSDSLKKAAGTSSSAPESNILKQNYGGNVNLKPQWNLKVYSFGLGELFSLNSDLASLAASTTGPDMLSKLTFNMGIPIWSFLKTRYSFAWEWSSINTLSPKTGNNFQHIFGITVSGDPVPLTFTASYSFSHGTRGLRHDVTSSLVVPFWGSFSLEGNFSLSYYTESGVVKVPFLGGLNLAYSF